MPTTTNGTPYTTTRIDLGDPDGVMNISIPNAMVGESDIPTILFAHGSGGADDQMAALTAFKPVFYRCMDLGWMVVEGSGGSDYYGTNNWGNLISQVSYPNYLAHAKTLHDVGPVVLFGRSMGGLITSILYSGDTTNQYAGWINMSGVSTMFVGSGRDTSVDRKLWASWAHFSPTFRDAWGADDFDELPELAGPYAPESFLPSSWAGKKMLNIYGTAENSVPWSTRGAGPLREIWQGLPAVDKVVAVQGADHPGTYNQPDAVEQFLQYDVLGLDPVSGDIFKRVSRTLYQPNGDVWHLKYRW